ncbi:hypothetical protein H0H92_009753, partial [Tricholoma furcatifolium]
MATNSTSSAAEAAAALAEKQGQAVVLWTVGMFCIFGWDYFMNLPKENQVYLEEEIHDIFHWEPVSALISTFLSQVIMGSRVYALYGKSNIVLGILGLIMAAEFGVQAYTLTTAFPVPGVGIPCIAVGPTNFLVVFWALPLAFNTITFVLTLYKLLEHWQNQVESATLSLLFCDGLVYFTAIFFMNLINVVLFVTQDSTLQVINLPATLMLNIIMSCRLILNLHKSQNQLPIPGSGNSSEPSKRVPLWNPQKETSDSYELSMPSHTTSSGLAVQTKTDVVQ